MLLPAKAIEGRAGFIGCYGLPPKTAVVVRERKGTWGLAECELYSDLLYIDIDNDIDRKETDRVAGILIEKEVSFGLHSSGSPNSYHFHIPTVPQSMVGLPSLHLLWIKQILGKDARVDFSIYKTSAIIKIAGAPHKMYPGVFKTLICEYVATTLDLTNFSVKYEPMVRKTMESRFNLEE
jgi:hypothetical protein